MTSPIYAIGDIHGHLDMMHDALRWIENDGGKDAQIVFMGDYVDRGPASREVIDFLIEGKKTNPNWVTLRGNHDVMFARWLEDVPYEDPHLLFGLFWLNPRIGGNTTLESYGVAVHEKRRNGEMHTEARDAVPQSHINFLMSNPLSFETEDKFFVHAGVRPNVALKDQTEFDQMWIREDFIPHTEPYEKLIVHGHTAIETPTHHGNRINTDGGAGRGRLLVPLVIEGSNAWTLSETGRTVMEPQLGSN